MNPNHNNYGKVVNLVALLISVVSLIFSVFGTPIAAVIGVTISLIAMLEFKGSRYKVMGIVGLIISSLSVIVVIIATIIISLGILESDKPVEVEPYPMGNIIFEEDTEEEKDDIKSETRVDTEEQDKNTENHDEDPNQLGSYTTPEEQMLYNLKGHGFTLEDGSYIKFNVSSDKFLWYQSVEDKEKEDNFYKGTYQFYIGTDAMEYIDENLAEEYGLTSVEMTEFLLRNSGNENYRWDNFIILAMHTDSIVYEGEEKEMDTDRCYYGFFYEADGKSVYDAANIKTASYQLFVRDENY